MENSSRSHSGRSSRSRMTPRKERGALSPARGHRQSKTGRTDEATSARRVKEEKKAERTEGAVDPDAEAKVKTTVVDIDSVRADVTKGESVGLLEAAELDSKRGRALHI